MPPQPLTLRLSAGSVRRVPARQLLCLGGLCWATQAGDSRDHVLRPGGTWRPSRRGRVLVWALTDAELCVEGAAWARLGRVRALLTGGVGANFAAAGAGPGGLQSSPRNG